MRAVLLGAVLLGLTEAKLKGLATLLQTVSSERLFHCVLMRQVFSRRNPNPGRLGEAKSSCSWALLFWGGGSDMSSSNLTL